MPVLAVMVSLAILVVVLVWWSPNRRVDEEVCYTVVTLLLHIETVMLQCCHTVRHAHFLQTSCRNRCSMTLVPAPILSRVVVAYTCKG
jgi:hypothetical protein